MKDVECLVYVMQT